MTNSDLPVVSVVVPVYNVAEYLPQCLQSLRSQTLSDIEVLCVDDGSEDGSAEMIADLQRQDPRLHLLRQAHRGVSAARNLGIKNARGKYVAFVDSDDWIDADMLRKMVGRAEHEDCDVVICSAQVHFEERGARGARRRKALYRALAVTEDRLVRLNNKVDGWKLAEYPGGWPFVWNKLIRRELLVNNGIHFSEALSLGEDGVFLQVLFQYAKRVAFIQDKLYHYRYQRKQSATVQLYDSQAGRFGEHIRVVEALCGELLDRDLLRANGCEVLRWLLSFLYSDYVGLLAEERWAAAKRIKEIFVCYRLAEFEQCLDRIQQRRLKNLLDAEGDCSKAGRMWDIVWTKVENRIVCRFL